MNLFLSWFPNSFFVSVYWTLSLASVLRDNFTTSLYLIYPSTFKGNCFVPSETANIFSLSLPFSCYLFHWENMLSEKNFLSSLTQQDRFLSIKNQQIDPQNQIHIHKWQIKNNFQVVRKQKQNNKKANNTKAQNQGCKEKQRVNESKIPLLLGICFRSQENMFIFGLSVSNSVISDSLQLHGL